MLPNRFAIAALLVAAPLSSLLGQRRAERFSWPVLAGAVSAGAVGFTDRASPRPALGGYAYAAFPRLILGMQAGKAAGGATSRATYGLLTLGYPARAIDESLVYPFVGGGIGSLHSLNGGRGTQPVYGAGVGADRVLGDGDRGIMMGLRGGYVFKTDDAGTRALYLTVAIGAAGRPGQKTEKPPVIVANR